VLGRSASAGGDGAKYWMNVLTELSNRGWGGEQKLLDADGKEYSTDDTAQAVMEDSNALLNEIDPGNTTEGKLVFDVPEQVGPEFVLFSGGPFDDAVKVELD